MEKVLLILYRCCNTELISIYFMTNIRNHLFYDLLLGLKE